MRLENRLKYSLRPALIHLAFGATIAATVAALLFLVWYPSPYDEFSGGRNLFVIVIGVDLICGPLLTLLLYVPSKPKKLLILDLSLVFLVQLAALLYGLHVAWIARPVYLVAEYDRLKAIIQADLTVEVFENLPAEIRGGFWKQPLIVGIRPPVSIDEKNKVMFDAAQGGRDYGERPEFYIPYGTESAQISLSRGRSLKSFIARHPGLEKWAKNYTARENIPLESVRYLPVMAREDWIAVLDRNGYISEFLRGDGF